MGRQFRDVPNLPRIMSTLQKIAEFDHPFRVTADGTLEDSGLNYVWAPEVYHDPENDIEIHGDGWEALTGYTGQHGYDGAVMHASEYLGGRLADDILATPGIYVAVVVEVHEVTDVETCPHIMDGESCAECGMEAGTDDGCSSHPDYDDGSQPAGWAILRLEQKV